LFNTPSDTPPRLRTIIENVRRHLGPLLAKEHYQAGKDAFDSKDFAAALKEFTLVVDLTEDTSETDVSAMRDVRVLAAGFLDLSRRAIAPPAPSLPPPTTVAKTTPAKIEPPVAIRQDLPQLSKELVIQMESHLSSFSGVLDLVIDAHGDVKSATLAQSIHPYYDGLLLSAAKHWKYRAAMKNGEPVEVAKRLTVKLDRRAASTSEPAK
jgi:hypothetical protein